MSCGRLAWVWLAFFLGVANNNSAPQLRLDGEKPIFEDSDFKVFSVRNPEALRAVSEDSNFGVLVFSADSATWPTRGTKCPFCFTGPTGRQNLLIFGTPDGVVPLAEKHFRVDESPIWVVVKQGDEITEQVFKKNLPEDFQDSVRADLFSIGFLADRASVGARPTEKEQIHARAGLKDLIFKSKWFSLFHDSAQIPPPRIHVKVHTIKSGSGREESRWTVWYVVDGWDGDKDHTYTFDNPSSPTEQDISPGPYRMWASRGKKQGPSKLVPVGDTASVTKELSLEIP